MNAADKSRASGNAASKRSATESTDVDHAVVKMIELLDSGILQPGIFGEVVILHEDGCPRIEGKGICRCDPDLQLLPPCEKRGPVCERDFERTRARRILARPISGRRGERESSREGNSATEVAAQTAVRSAERGDFFARSNRAIRNSGQVDSRDWFFTGTQ